MYAKYHTHGSTRMMGLINNYKVPLPKLISPSHSHVNLLQICLQHLDSLNTQWFCNDPDQTGLYDFFEPTMLFPCYQNNNKHLFLGSLIFGNKEWTRLCPHPERLTGPENPLTKMFEHHGKTHYQLPSIVQSMV